MNPIHLPTHRTLMVTYGLGRAIVARCCAIAASILISWGEGLVVGDKAAIVVASIPSEGGCFDDVELCKVFLYLSDDALVVPWVKQAECFVAAEAEREFDFDRAAEQAHAIDIGEESAPAAGCLQLVTAALPAS